MVLCWWDAAKHWQLNANGCGGVPVQPSIPDLYFNCTGLGKTKLALLNNYYLVCGDGVMGFGRGLGA